MASLGPSVAASAVRAATKLVIAGCLVLMNLNAWGYITDQVKWERSGGEIASLWRQILTDRATPLWARPAPALLQHFVRFAGIFNTWGLDYNYNSEWAIVCGGSSRQSPGAVARHTLRTPAPDLGPRQP